MPEQFSKNEAPKKEAPKTSPLTALSSVFRAWFGVQTEANRQRDFASGDAKPFIIAGILFTVAMVVGVMVLVNIALSTTNPP